MINGCMFHLCENHTDHRAVNGVKGTAFERTWADFFFLQLLGRVIYVVVCVYVCVVPCVLVKSDIKTVLEKKAKKGWMKENGHMAN